MLDAILNIWLEAYAVITYETLAHDWSFVENDKMMLIKSFFRRIIKDFRHKELLPLKMIFFVQASSKYFSRLIDRQLKLIEQQIDISTFRFIRKLREWVYRFVAIWSVTMIIRKTFYWKFILLFFPEFFLSS